MLIIVVLLLILILLVLAVIALRLIYFWKFPEETTENLINSSSLLKNLAEAGLKGFDGEDAELKDHAFSGATGAHGAIGAHGISGEKNMRVGGKGGRGLPGVIGPGGSIGSMGDRGLPSNSLVPYSLREHANDLHKSPYTFEHHFNYGDTLYKLSGFFIFEDVNYFSFTNGLNNKRFNLKLDPKFKPIVAGDVIPPIVDPTLTSIDIHAKKIYSTIRVIVERKSKTSDGTVFYTSAPIEKNGYLIRSNVNLNERFSAGNKLDEINIEHNKEFGLDFEIEQNPALLYNFMLGGILRYKCIFNIEPPNIDLVPRIEERLSSEPIKELCVPTYKLEAKGNVRKISNLDGVIGAVGPADNIYMLSPRLDTGLVVYKNSSDSKNLWTVTSSKQLELDDADDNNPLVEAFEALTKDRLTFKDELEKAKTIKVYDTYDSPTIQQNIKIRYIKDALVTGVNSNKYPTTPSSLPDINQSEDLFTTKMIFNNLSIVYPNTKSELTYPTILNNSNLFIKFIVKINLKNITKIKYEVYLKNTESIGLNPFIVEEDKKIIISSRNPTLTPAIVSGVNNYFPATPSLPISYTNDHLYYDITINKKDNLFFENFFGRQIILKFSLSDLNFQSKFTRIDIVNNPPFSSTEDSFILMYTTNGYEQKSKSRFQGSNTDHKFSSATNDDVIGFNMTFVSEKFDIESNTFEIGYQDPGSNTIFSQRVVGVKQTNGDYFIPVPTTGYPVIGY